LVQPYVFSFLSRQKRNKKGDPKSKTARFRVVPWLDFSTTVVKTSGSLVDLQLTFVHSLNVFWVHDFQLRLQMPHRMILRKFLFNQSLHKVPLSVRSRLQSGLKTMSAANFFKEAKAAPLQ
jgi:hypothetical protein